MKGGHMEWIQERRSVLKNNSKLSYYPLRCVCVHMCIGVRSLKLLSGLSPVIPLPHFLKMFLTLFSVCVHARARVYTHIPQHVCKSQRTTFRSRFSPHHVVSKDCMQAIRRGDRHPCPLSHLPSPAYILRCGCSLTEPGAH